MKRVDHQLMPVSEHHKIVIQFGDALYTIQSHHDGLKITRASLESLSDKMIVMPIAANSVILCGLDELQL